jgi:hypothetical protein
MHYFQVYISNPKIIAVHLEKIVVHEICVANVYCIPNKYKSQEPNPSSLLLPLQKKKSIGDEEREEGESRASKQP